MVKIFANENNFIFFIPRIIDNKFTTLNLQLSQTCSVDYCNLNFQYIKIYHIYTITLQRNVNILAVRLLYATSAV